MPPKALWHQECQRYSPKHTTLLQKILWSKFKYENQQRAFTPKVLCLELWFLCTALLLNKIYLPMKFQVSSLNTFWVMLLTKFKNENEQRAITQKVWSFGLWFLCNAHLLNEIYLPMKFQVSRLNTFWVMLRTKFKNENEQRAITPKVWCQELWFFCTALHLNEIYLPMKFHVDALHRFLSYAPDKKGTDRRTDWLSDKSITICHPSGALNPN